MIVCDPKARPRESFSSRDQRSQRWADTMSDNWRIGVALGLAVLVGGTNASAQTGGTDASAQTGGTVRVPRSAERTRAQPGGNSNRGLSDPALDEEKAKDDMPKKLVPPRPTRNSSFNRVTSTRASWCPPRRSARRAGTSGAAGKGSQTGQLHPHAIQAVKDRARAADSQVPQGSSWNDGAATAPESSPDDRSLDNTELLSRDAARSAPQCQPVQLARAGKGRIGVPGLPMGLGMNNATPPAPGSIAPPGKARGSARGSAGQAQR